MFDGLSLIGYVTTDVEAQQLAAQGFVLKTDNKVPVLCKGDDVRYVTHPVAYALMLSSLPGATAGERRSARTLYASAQATARARAA